MNWRENNALELFAQIRHNLDHLPDLERAPHWRVLEIAMASASRMWRMAAVIVPRNSAANAVPHDASNPPTDLPYIKVTDGIGRVKWRTAPP